MLIKIFYLSTFPYKGNHNAMYGKLGNDSDSEVFN